MISTIRPIVTFAAETWNFEGEGYELFNDLRKKNPEEDFWSDQERDGWRIRTNHELNKLTGGSNTVRFIKAQRLKWWSHLYTMEEYRTVRRIFEWSPMGKRSRENVQGTDERMKS